MDRKTKEGTPWFCYFNPTGHRARRRRPASGRARWRRRFRRRRGRRSCRAVRRSPWRRRVGDVAQARHIVAAGRDDGVTLANQNPRPKSWSSRVRALGDAVAIRPRGTRRQPPARRLRPLYLLAAPAASQPCPPSCRSIRSPHLHQAVEHHAGKDQEAQIAGWTEQHPGSDSGSAMSSCPELHMAWNTAATMAMVKTHPAPASQAASQISSSARAKNSASQRGVAAPS